MEVKGLDFTPAGGSVAKLDLTGEIDFNGESLLQLIEHEQREDGFMFQAEVPIEAELVANVKRSIGFGAANAPQESVSARLPRFLEQGPGTKKILIPDRLKPSELVGEELRYEISIQNRHGRVVRHGAVKTFREALEIPPAPQSPVACLNLITNKIELEIFREVRPLDACGFYGDPDDLALLEG